MKKVSTLVFFLVVIVVNVIFSEPFVEFDAVSSASGKYYIYGGKIYPHRAEFYCWGAYNNGKMWLRWGEEASAAKDTVESNVLHLPFGTDTLHVCDLDSEVEYSYSYYGYWEGKDYPDMIVGTFTTPKSNSPVAKSKNSQKNMDKYDIRVCNNNIMLPNKLSGLPVKIEVRSLKGQLLKQINYGAVKIKEVALENLVKGVNIINVYSSDNHIKTLRLINN